MKKYILTFALILYSTFGVSNAYAGSVKLQTAEGPMTFKISNGGATGSENDWVSMTIAGYRFEKGRMALGWHFGFAAKVEDIAQAQVWDITEPPAQLLISDGHVQLKDGRWYASTDMADITLESEPWLSEKGPTLRAYKILLTNASGETRTLYQLAVFGKEMKLYTLKSLRGEDIEAKQ